MTGPEIIVLADPAAVSDAAAERIAASLGGAVDRRGRADWAATGGSAAVGIYRSLVGPARRDAVPWAQVHTWWGDDRFVPSDHPLSNIKAFDDIVLDRTGHQAGAALGSTTGVPIPAENLHPFRTTEAIGKGLDAAACATLVADELRAAGLPQADGWPVFDLVVLGIGPDGHILSVFPGSEAFDSRDWALGIAAPTHVEPHVARVTFNPAIVTAAREVLVVAHGAGKAEIVRTVLGDETDVRRWPAQLARRDGATWILDEAAAASLRERP
jgi:6-phosphogluconolactonase